MTIELTNQGATTWEEYHEKSPHTVKKPFVWEAPLIWAGRHWHWEDNKFVRGWDEVDLLTTWGISLLRQSDDDTNILRGDLELLELTKDTTKLKYYSAWVEDSLLQPYLTIVPKSRSSPSQPNPLLEIESTLD